MSTVSSVTAATTYSLSQPSLSEVFVDEYMAQFEKELAGIASKAGKKSPINGCMQAVRSTARTILERISSLEGRSQIDLFELAERALRDLSASARQQCFSIETVGALARTDAHIAAFGEHERTYHFPSQGQLQGCLENDPGFAQDTYLKEKGVMKAVAASFAGSKKVDAAIDLDSFAKLRVVNETLKLHPKTLTITHKKFVKALKKCAVDPTPAVPAASTHSTAEDLFKGMVQGELARKTHHRFGRRGAAATETAIGACLAEPQQKSASPGRDCFVSGAVHAGMVEAAGTLVKRVPAYMALVATHGLGEMAREAESGVQRFLDRHTAEEYARYASGGEYPNPYDGALAARALLQAAQLPSRALHAVHHQLTESAGQVLDTIGMTDENAKKVLDFVAEHPVEFPVLP